MMLLISAMIVAAHTVFVAHIPSFGCSSIGDVRDLAAVRADDAKFQTKLLERIVHGQCALIAEGTVVEGAASDDPAIMLIQAERDPPGYLAPVSDFVLRRAPETPVEKNAIDP